VFSVPRSVFSVCFGGVEFLLGSMGIRLQGVQSLG